MTAAEGRAELAERRSGDHPLAARSLSQTLSAVRGFHAFLDRGEIDVDFSHVQCLFVTGLSALGRRRSSRWSSCHWLRRNAHFL